MTNNPVGSAHPGIAPSEGLRTLIDAALDASFACGEWTKDDDESFEEIDDAAKATHQALADRVAALEQALAKATRALILERDVAYDSYTSSDGKYDDPECEQEVIDQCRIALGLQAIGDLSPLLSSDSWRKA